MSEVSTEAPKVDSPAEPPKEWAILELLGHRRLGGIVSEAERYGSKCCRIDIPDPKDPSRIVATQFYWPKAIYGMTICTQEVAVEAARYCQPEPVYRLGLPTYVDHGGTGEGDDM